MRVVFDSNVAVSSMFATTSTSARAIDKAIRYDTLLVSIATITELREVLTRAKFDRYASASERRALFRRLVDAGEAVAIDVNIQACRDPKDNMILELAVSGQADCIITGDRDLLALDPFRGIRIVTPEVFLKMQ